MEQLYMVMKWLKPSTKDCNRGGFVVMYRGYEQPIMEVIRFVITDVITSSIQDGGTAGWGDNEFQEPYNY